MPDLLLALATASILIQVTPNGPSMSRLDLTVTGLSEADAKAILEQVLRDFDAPPAEIPEGEDRG